MFGWLFNKKLEDAISRTKKIKVCGVRFVIKQVDMFNYLDGSRVMIQAYDTHKTKGEKSAELSPVSNDKVKRHFKEIICAGVVSPKIVASEKEEGMLVDRLFSNWDLVNELYNEIMSLTYGKKKLKQAISAERNLSK